MAAKANLLGKRKPEDSLETKPFLKKHKEKSDEKETTKGFADSLQQPDEANLISVKELFVGHLSRQTKISDIIDFFKDVAQVVRVRLIVSRKEGVHAGFGFVEFASANEAKKALEKKGGEYLQDHKIFLDVAKNAPYPSRPKYCIDHKVVWYEDYLRRESLLIEEDETVEGLVEEVAVTKKTLFVANLSPQTEILDVCRFFHNVGKVVSLRLIVNHEGKHVGCGFVEFVSANEAKKALEKKKGEYLHDHKIFLDVAKIAPYPPRTKYNLAEKLWYEDYLERESLPIEGGERPPDFVEEVAARKKTLFVGHLSRQTEILDICKFFHNVGEVVHVRLVVDHKGRHCYGFVEFASANEAKMALEKKNGENLHDRKIILDVAKGAKYLPPRYWLDHKVWYEDYLRRESPLIEEDETVEGLVEEVAVRKKTLFVANLSPQTEILDVCKFFHKVGKLSLRLIVNHEGKHVGCGFAEFDSANEAKKALKKKGEYLLDHKIFLDVAKIAPYPPRPKYNLAEKLWYEDYIRLTEDNVETKPILKFCRTKTTFVDVDDGEAF